MKRVIFLFASLLLSQTSLPCLGQSTHSQMGEYVIAPDGRVGTIGSHIKRGRVVISFHDKEKQTEHSESYRTSEVIFSQELIHLPAKGNDLVVGDYVSVTTDNVTSSQKSWLDVIPSFFEESVAENIIYMQVEAIFPDQILLKSLHDKYNMHYTARSEFLFQTDQIENILAKNDILKSLSDQILDLSNEEFDWMIDSLDEYLICLEENVCDINVKLRSWQKDSNRLSLFGALTDKRVLEDFKISSKEELLSRLQEQAIQFKILTGLVHADTLTQETKAVGLGHSRHHFLKPLPGLDGIRFSRLGPYREAVVKIAEQDILTSRNLIGGILGMGGVKESHLGGLYDSSESCSQAGCQKANHYKDIIRPLYEVFLHELAQTQSYLVYLNWRLDKRDFIIAMKKAKREIRKTKKMINRLRNEEKLFLLSFVTTFERIVDDYSLQQQELIRALLEVEAENQSFWRDLTREIKKPRFWGIMSCYGITIFTPAKFMNLICHTAGLAVTGESLVSTIQKTQNYYHMQKMRMIPTETYYEVAFGLAIEAALAAFYVKAVTPDFRYALNNGLKSASSSSATQTALGMQRALVRNRGVKDTLDHIRQTLQKMLGGALFSSQASATALISQFLGGKTVEDMTMQRGGDLFKDQLASVGFLFSTALEQPALQKMMPCSPIPEFHPSEITEEIQSLIDEVKEIKEELKKELGCIEAPRQSQVKRLNSKLINSLKSQLDIGARP